MEGLEHAPSWAQHMMWVFSALTVGACAGWRVVQMFVARRNVNGIIGTFLAPQLQQIKANQEAILALKSRVENIEARHDRQHQENVGRLVQILERMG